ncbi:30S ribosomal protein S16 [Kiritimatiellota bacterium B12222]|nr:30S ribosomal protein S16 [Kiritimatiellota bacterium B12222]
MSVRIRLTRMGNRNNPFYRIIVANSANANKGKAIEFLGTYDPKGGGRTVLKKARYDYWLSVGAIPSDTVRSLIDRAIEHATTVTKPSKATEEVAEESAVEETVAAAE